MEMDIIKELNLLIQMHYSCDIDSRDEWLREIIYLKSRFESKVNNSVLDDVSKCCGNCDEAIINEPYCERCYDLANSRDNT